MTNNNQMAKPVLQVVSAPAKTSCSDMLHTLMGTMSDGAFIVRVDTTPQGYSFEMDGVNPRLQRLLPAPPQSGLLHDVLPHKVAKWLERRLIKTCVGGHVASFRVTTDFLNGGTQHLKLTLAPVANSTGGVSAVVGTVRVLTETVRLCQQAQTQRHRFAAAIEYAPYGLCFADMLGQPLFVNRLLSAWLDTPQHTLMNKHISAFIHADDRAMFAQAFKKVAGAERIYRQIEVRMHTDDTATEAVWTLVNMSLVHDTGKAPYVMVQFTDISSRKQHEEALVKLAHHDHLTGLANRKVFEDALHSALKNARRYHRHGAVLFIDLNNFKQVNDQFGHKAGDAILQQVAAVLRHAVRETDVLARIGGDEFAIILQESNPAGARLKALEIEQAVAAASAMAHGKMVRVGASVGVYLFDGTDLDMTIDAVVAAADRDMYRNKAAAKRRLQVIS